MKTISFSILSLLLFLVAGCSSLRRDFYEESAHYAVPTQGGRWTERGLLEEDLGSSDPLGRGIASDSDQYVRTGGQWVDSARADANRRELYRNRGLASEDEVGFNYQNNPNLKPPVMRSYKNGKRATRADFVDDTGDGSLWASDGQTNYFFTKNKVRSIGDIVTIQLEDEIINDVGAEVKRTLSKDEFEAELLVAQEKLKQESKGASGAPGSGAARQPAQAGAANAGNQAPAQEPEVREALPSDIDVKPSLSVKKGDSVMAEIVERYPNGNYKIRGSKKILYKTGAPRLLQVVAITKGTDISEEDTVSSGKLYEYRLEALR